MLEWNKEPGLGEVGKANSWDSRDQGRQEFSTGSKTYAKESVDYEGLGVPVVCMSGQGWSLVSTGGAPLLALSS